MSRIEKSRKYLRLVTVILIFFTATVLTSMNGLEQSVAQTETGFEQPPITLQVSKVLPKDMLVGPNYRIKETVKNDGFVNTYMLSTEYGPLKVESTALLTIRIHELTALQKMEALEETEVFQDALEKSAKAPLKTAKGMVTHPVDTVSGVATGIGHWVSDVGRSIVSDDPHQPGVLSTALGYAAAKRHFAYEFGIDPYTRYGPVQERLNEISRVGFAGGLAPKVAFRAVQTVAPAAGLVLTVTSTADTMRQLVRDKSPEELDDINDEKLKAMEVPESTRKAFLKNHDYSPQEATLLVGELDSMKNVAGREKFIAVAAQVTEESVALFMRLRAQMMAHYYAKVEKSVRIIEVNGTPLLQRKDGVVAALVPLDYVAWTAALWRKESALSESAKKLPGIKGKKLWIEGTVSPMARQNLQGKGWKVRENAGLLWSGM
jgi:hypothetical protein